MIHHHLRRMRRHGQLAAIAPASDGLWAQTAVPPREGNALEVLIDGENALPAMAEAIRNAQRHVHVCSWHLEPDFDPGPRDARPVRELLAETAERVPVRVLVWAGAPVPGLPAPPRAGQGRARRAREGHEDPVRARRARPHDALPPREARDRRRRDRVRRRHRPDRAGRRPLRLQRAPAQARRDRLARRLLAAARADRARRRRPLRAALGGRPRRGARAARDARARRRRHRPVHPHGPRGRLRRAPARRVLDPRELRPRAAQRAAPDLPREPVPVVARDRRDPRGQAAQPAERRLPRRRPAAAQGQQRPGRHARDARPPRRRRRAAAGTSSPPRSCRAPASAPARSTCTPRSASSTTRWLAIGSANLNEHSLFNDSEVDVVTQRPAPRPRHPPAPVGGAPRGRRRRRPGDGASTSSGARSRASSWSAAAPERH